MKTIIKSEGTKLILSIIVSLILFILCVANIESKLEPIPHYLMVGGFIVSAIYFAKFWHTYEKLYFVLWPEKWQNRFKLWGNGIMMLSSGFLIYITPENHVFIVLFRILVFGIFLFYFIKALKSNEN